MGKWISVLLVLACALPGPAQAAAWKIGVKAATVGGGVSVRGATPVSFANGTVYYNYTTSAANPNSVGVTVTPASICYAIQKVVYNTTTVINPSAPRTRSFSPADGASQTAIAYFYATQLSVTASVAGNTGGTVSPASGFLFSCGSTPSADIVFNFTPSAGESVASIGNVPAGALQSGSFGVTNGAVSITIPQAVAATLTGSLSLVATFSGVSANAGYTQTAFPGQTVTLSGSATPAAGASFSWLPSAGNPAPVALSDPAAPSPSFTAPASNGTYYFNLSVNGGAAQASTTVYVTNSNPSAARFLCVNCHQNSNIGPGVYQLWSSSRHSRYSQNSCQACHVGNANGGHPGTLTSGTVNETTFTYVSTGAVFCLNCHNPAIVAGYSGSLHPANSVTCGSCHTSGVHDTDFNPSACDGCHRDSSGNVPLHPLAIGTSSCVSCHDPHTTLAMAGAPGSHFNNQTSAGYPASYMTSRSSCSNCHDGTPANQLLRKQWDVAGHGATTEPPWMVLDFKTKSGCVQCHTTTGFLAYSTGKVSAAWGVASDKTKEVLTCIACHSDISAGTVRSVTPVRPFADDSYQNRPVGASNICMDCHSGTNNGKSIQAKVGGADFSNQPFIAPHYLAAVGTLHAVSGYHFPGQSYAFYSSNTHRSIGLGNNNATGTAGPCVACHMSASQDHLFKTVTADSSGSISAISATVCANCHAGSLGVAQLNADKTLFSNALTVLKAQLAARGFSYTPSYPFFSNTNWGVGQDGANVMGAAFNYVLMVSEPGAYAHNSQYAKKLVLDSIDYLDNGQLDGSVATLAVPTLLASGAISQAVADSFTAYQAKKDSCTVCHGGTAASATPMATNAHPAHLTGAYGPGLFLGSSVSSCQACHPYGSASHMNGVVDLVNGAGSACQGCHAGAAPAWNATARLDCTGCHAAVPAQLPNGVAAPYKGNFTSTGHGQFAASNQCTICHDPNSNHISGSLGSYNRLLMPDDSTLCASCHNNASVVGAAFLNMSSHVTKDGRVLNCQECHDPHGTTNLSMIRQTINGSTIVFTDNVNGLIDQVSNRGLCQVCHTLTSHYLAGVPETGHYSSGCLNCHSHNSAGGAFQPSGGSCDSCHGYPPVPRNTGSNFGTTNNWANARYEDYSGGGGAHQATPHISPFAVATEGWANCTACHNGGQTGSTPYHRMTTPVANHIGNVTVLVDPALRFADGFTVYTGAQRVNQPARNSTGSCFNISCHMTQSPRWSTER